MSQNRKPVALAIGATLAGGLALSGSAFASTPLAQGYLLGAQEAGTAAADAHADKKKEGSCGVAAMDSDKDGKVSRTEFEAMHAGQGAVFDEIDTDKDGFMDADESKAHSEGRCGSDKKADDAKPAGKSGMEGKCGEGKCGGM
ncbi:MAG TPA: hypothetical protein VFF71_04830 [Luteimonas sp.]|nr:hypothetical protein [Luteimonas sp.]